jgi:hypothetical protein
MPELRVDLTRLPGVRALRNPGVRGLALSIVAAGALVYFLLPSHPCPLRHGS